ncbi:hypothetical protein [Sulfurimonas sp.]|uniref:hypothetical protein n=1 Tax=Sulfurimonas sp. TaxID=2022749 RepID=UPI00262A5751|nr:hypothetical protein [Sulfurimonas sp.]
MQIQTRYNYEKKWTLTDENELLKIIEEEIGDADVQGTLRYVKEVISKGKEITIGSCKFRKQQAQEK